MKPSAFAKLAWQGRRTGAALLSGLLFGACTSTPLEHQYSLRPALNRPASGVAASVRGGNSGLSIVVSAVQVPQSLDRAEWVVRRKGTEMQVLEQQLWVQPLAAELAEALVDHLNQLNRDSAGAVAFVDPGGQSPAGPGKAFVRVQLRVLRMDTLLFPAPGIDDQLQWTAQCVLPAAKEPSPDRRSGTLASTPADFAQAGAPDAKGMSYEALAAAHAAVVSRVSASLNQAVQELASRCTAG